MGSKTEYDFETARPEHISPTDLTWQREAVRSTHMGTGNTHSLYRIGRDLFVHTKTANKDNPTGEQILAVGHATATVDIPEPDWPLESLENLDIEIDDNIRAKLEEESAIQKILRSIEQRVKTNPADFDNTYFDGETVYVDAESHARAFFQGLFNIDKDLDLLDRMYEIFCEIATTDRTEPEVFNVPHVPVEFSLEEIYFWELRAELFVEYGSFKGADQTAKTAALNERGFKQTEIADILDIDQGTVSRNLGRAVDIRERADWTLKNVPEIDR